MVPNLHCPPVEGLKVDVERADLRETGGDAHGSDAVELCRKLAVFTEPGHDLVFRAGAHLARKRRRTRTKKQISTTKQVHQATKAKVMNNADELWFASPARAEGPDVARR